MKWIVYSAVMTNQVTRQAVEQIRRAPITGTGEAALAAERLGGTLLSVQPDVRRAEGLRRLTELQASLAGRTVVEWCPPEEWQQETPRSFPVPRVFVTGRFPRPASSHPSAASSQ
jgi:hypothetical protein